MQQKYKGRNEDTLSEIKKNLQGTNSEGKEAGIQINDLEHKKGKNNQSEQQEEKRIQKNEDSISSLWDSLNRSNMCIIGVPEGKEEEQEIGNLYEKILKENLPNLMKEIHMQVQEAQRVPNNMDAKRPTLRHIIIKIPKVKDKRLS